MQRGDLKESRSVLRDFGNMSAVTVLFVAERMQVLKRPAHLADRAGTRLLRRLPDAGWAMIARSPIAIILALVVLQRLGELALANRNTRRLDGAGRGGNRRRPLSLDRDAARRLAAGGALAPAASRCAFIGAGWASSCCCRRRASG